jgi:hypothetical protein
MSRTNSPNAIRFSHRHALRERCDVARKGFKLRTAAVGRAPLFVLRLYNHARANHTKPWERKPMKKRVQAVIDSLERQGIDVERITPRLAESLSGMHLRFDRVALRFIDDMQSALHEVVPEGKVLVFTITAPLRLASKTAATLAENVRALLARRRARLDLDATVNGNRIRVRLLKGVSNAKVVGFVHNPDCDPEILFDAIQSLLRRVG